jgi:predicted AAA+ superfamily ATPase
MSESFFLFGARGTGKTSLLKELFASVDPASVLRFDLLVAAQEQRLALDPKLLRSEVELRKSKWVVIDEIQKLPQLLNAVHDMIEDEALGNVHFALTGSSARKLKRAGVNLLAGRAFVNHLFPLTHIELAHDFSLEGALSWGTLPKIHALTTARQRASFLRSYTATYLKEEIWAEHLIEKLEPFRKFLPIAAQMSGETVNYTAIARDVGVHDKTVRTYYDILSDTLLGFHLESFHASLRKRQRRAPKFYLFDCGVTRALRGQLTAAMTPGSADFGTAFEQWVICEFHRLSSYQEDEAKFSYLSTDQAEIDLIIERPGQRTALIEIKSKAVATHGDGRHLRSFLSDFENADAYVISQDPIARIEDGVRYFHWREGFEQLRFDGRPVLD